MGCRDGNLCDPELPDDHEDPVAAAATSLASSAVIATAADNWSQLTNRNSSKKANSYVIFYSIPWVTSNATAAEASAQSKQCLSALARDTNADSISCKQGLQQQRDALGTNRESAIDLLNIVLWASVAWM